MGVGTWVDQPDRPRPGRAAFSSGRALRAELFEASSHTSAHHPSVHLFSRLSPSLRPVPAQALQLPSPLRCTTSPRALSSPCPSTTLPAPNGRPSSGRPCLAWRSRSEASS
eukprot:363037-Chlamydomonas_euryale.AAC.2